MWGASSESNVGTSVALEGDARRHPVRRAWRFWRSPKRNSRVISESSHVGRPRITRMNEFEFTSCISTNGSGITLRMEIQ